jgi:hypothetical protein
MQTETPGSLIAQPAEGAEEVKSLCEKRVAGHKGVRKREPLFGGSETCLRQGGLRHCVAVSCYETPLIG